MKLVDAGLMDDDRGKFVRRVICNAPDDSSPTGITVTIRLAT